MKRFQILCVTMNQSDFSKIKDMNIHSDVVFTNQADRTAFAEYCFDGHTAKMITTATRGVGINRNMGLIYADAEICLFADDDVVYVDDLENRVLKEFDTHPDADIIVFNFDTEENSERKERKYAHTRKCRKIERMPWAGFRIAFRLNSVRKANVWFTILFGGGCIFPSGEDSMWLHDAKKKGLTVYVSKETIGTVSFATSTWYTGKNESFFYGKGAYCQAVHSNTFSIWALYYVWRHRENCALDFRQRLKYMFHGREGYREMVSFKEYSEG